MFLIIRIFFYSILTIFLVYDSKNRDMNEKLWILISLFFCFMGISGFGINDFISFIILYLAYFICYIIIRPKGELIFCSKCFNKKMIEKLYCPHCFNIDEQLLKNESMLIDKNRG